MINFSFSIVKVMRSFTFLSTGMWLFLLLISTNVGAQNCPTLNADGVYNFEDDVFMTSYHQTILKTINGFSLFGEDSGADGHTDNMTLLDLSVANGYTYSGTPIQATVSGADHGQFFLLTTVGLYAWGYENKSVSDVLTSGRGIQEISLPLGLTPSDIKDIQATHGAFYVLTNDAHGGKVYVSEVESFYASLSYKTAGTGWYQIEVSSGVDLTNVRQINCATATGYAILNTNEIYSWGYNVVKGNNSAATDSKYAVKLQDLPNAASPISLASFMDGSSYSSYSAYDSGVLVMGTDNRAYGLGHSGSDAAIINNHTGFVLTWEAIEDSAGSIMEDVVFLTTTFSARRYAAAGVILRDKRLKVWGKSNASSIGSLGNLAYPTVPGGFVVGTNKAVFLSLGGHGSSYVDYNEVDAMLCFVGHVTSGSTGGMIPGTATSFECVPIDGLGLCVSAPTPAPKGVLWLRADDGVNINGSLPSDNTGLLTWFDQFTDDVSQNGGNATAHTGESGESPLPTLPLFKNNPIDNINFNPVLEFSSANAGNAVQINTPAKASQTIFVVFDADGNGSSQYNQSLLYGGDISTPSTGEIGLHSDMSFGVAIGNRISFGGGHSGDYFNMGDIDIESVPAIGVLSRDVINSNDVNYSLYANGSQDELNISATSLKSGQIGAGYPLPKTMRIGTHYSGGNTFDGKVSEVLVYDGVLTTQKQQIVESYLAVKYGITLTNTADDLGARIGNSNYNYLNSDGNVIWAPDPVYKFDVAGIGKDLATYDLEQKVSKSVNKNTLVTMATSADFELSNTHLSRISITSDKSFLMWANNHGTENFVSTEKEAVVQDRLGREWKVQKTANFSNVINLQVDLNASTASSVLNVGNLFLAVDNDGDFNSGVTYSDATSYVNGKVSFANVTLTNGQYFTVVTKVGANNVPVAVDDSYNVDEDGSVELLPLTGDSDLDGNTLSITEINGITLIPGSVQTISVPNGTVKITVLGVITFEPLSNYNGFVSFSYTINDGNGGAAIASQNITVAPVNDAPIAVSDTATTAEDTPIDLGIVDIVTPNDTDPDGNALTITGVSNPVNGTVELVGQIVTFTPASNYVGNTATFDYTISDGVLEDTATVTINVTAVNDPPAVDSSSITVEEDSNDTSLGLSAPTDIDTAVGTLTIKVSGLPSLGTVTLSDGSAVVNGAILTIAQLTSLQYDAPSEYTAGTAVGEFKYTVTDGTSTVTGKTTIVVTAVNDAPVADNSSITVLEESTNTGLGLTAPTDVDTAVGTLTIKVSGLPILGTVTLSDGSAVANGASLTIAQLTSLQYDAPSEYTAGTAVGEFKYTVNDGTSTVTGKTTIVVTPVNDAPVADNSSIIVLEESTNTNLGLTAPTDVDTAVGTLTIKVSGLPILGTVTLSDGSAVANGASLTIAQLTSLQYDAPSEYTAGTAVGEFKYTVTDGTSTVTGKTTIVVTAVNDAPVADSSSITVEEDSNDTSLGLSAPTDIDTAVGTLTIKVSGLPSLGTVTLSDGTTVANGASLSIAQLTSLQYDAPSVYTGGVVGDFVYRVYDGTTTVIGRTTIVVTIVNDPPVADSSSITVLEESTNTGLGLTAPTDVDTAVGTLTIKVSGLPSLGTVTLSDGSAVANGASLTIAQLTSLQYDAPSEYTAGTAVGEFKYTVNDGNSTVTGKTTIVVTPVNDAPVADNSSITVLEESTNTGLGLTAPTDVDTAVGTLTIKVSGLPSLGTVTLSDGTAVASGASLTIAQLTSLQYDAPSEYTAGTAVGEFTYTVTDGNSTVTGKTTIVVTPVNDAPVADNSSITVLEESINTGLGLTAPTDVDTAVGTLTIKVSGLPSLGTVTLSDGSAVANGASLTIAQLTSLQYDAPSEYTAGTAVGEFKYTVNDGDSTVTGKTTIVVTPVNDAPVADNSSITVFEESTNTGLGLTAPTDVDTAVGTLTIKVSGLPSLGTVTLSDGTAVASGASLTIAQLTSLQYDAPSEYTAGTAVGEFTYTVTDGNSTVTGKTTIVVTPVNDAPVVDSSSITVLEESTNTGLGLTAPTDVDTAVGTLTIKVSGLPSLGTVTLSDGTAVASGASLTIAQLTSLQYDAPSEYTAGTAVGEFKYTVNDGDSTVTGKTTIVVTAVNDAPVVGSSSITVLEESTNTGLGLTAPTDVDTAVGTLTIKVSGLPSLGTVTLSDGSAVANGASLTIAQLTSLQYDAPSEYTAGTAVGEFKYTVTDGNSTVTGKTTIVVTPVNDAPVVDSSSITVLEESTNTGLGLTAPTDVDTAVGTLTIKVSGLPSLGTVTLSDGTAVASGASLTIAQLTSLQYDAPSEYTAGTAVGEFKYTVTDGNSTVTGKTTIVVTPVNDAPVVDSSSITVLEESTNTGLGLTAPTDVDTAVGTLTIKVSGLPSLGTVTLSDGTAVANGASLTIAQLTSLQYDAPSEYTAGTAVGEFKYTVTDGDSTVTGKTTIVVTPVNDAPVVDSSSITVLEESTNTGLGLTAPTDVDTAVGTLTIKVSGLPSLGTVTLSDGTAVASGASLTIAQLTSLQYDAPSEYTAGTAVGEFKYTVTDGDSTVTGKTTIVVTPVNDAPVVDSSSITVLEESTNTGLGLTAPTDVDTAVGTLTIKVSGLPILGTVTLSDGSAVANGASLTIAQLTSLQYDAPSEYTAGTAVGEFKYTVTDGDSTVTGKTTIVVTPVNDAPVVDSSSITVLEESTNTGLGLTAPTDVDTAVGTLTIKVSGLPILGTVTLSDGSAVANGASLTIAQLTSLQYDAPSEYTAGTAVGEFKYTVTDGNSTVTGKTTIVVTPVNDAPVVDSSSITVLEESTNTGLGLTAPTDVDTAVGTLTIKVSGLPSLGTVTLSDGTAVASGASLTIAQLTSLQYDAPSEYTAGTAVGEFTYTVTDGDSTVTGKTTIVVTPVNDAPVVDSSSITVLEESTNTGLGLTAPTDVDTAVGTLTIKVSGLPSLGTVTLSDGSAVANGASLTIAQLTSLQYDAPSEYTAGTAVGEFKYTVTDGNSTVTGKTTITVTPVNDAPVADNETETATEDTDLVIDVKVGDTDVDGTIDPTTVVIITSPTKGTVRVNASTGKVTYSPMANYIGPDSFTYTIKDNNGLVSNTATVSITVNAVNDAPVADNETETTNEDTDLVVDVKVGDTDIDGTIDPTTVVITTIPTNGTVSVNATTGKVTYSPTANYSGPDSFTYTIKDNNGLVSNIATVSITVNAVNDAPVADNETETTNEDIDLVVDVKVGDTDIDGTIDPTTVVITTIPTNGTVSVNATTGKVTYSPTANYSGPDSFTYTIKDNNGLVSNTATVSITVIAIEDKTIAKDDIAKVDEDASVDIDVITNDTDVDSANSQVSTITQPVNGITEINTDGTVKYTPNLNFNGEDTFTYTNVDGNTATVVVTVSPVNDAPVAKDDLVEVQEGESIVISVIDNDKDPNDLLGGIDPGSVTIVKQPVHGSVVVHAITGEITYTPGVGDFEGDTFEYSVCDTGNPLPAKCDTATVTITINSFELKDDNENIEEDASVITSVLLNDTDPFFIIDKATLIISKDPANGIVSVDVETGKVTYVPNADFNGVDSYEYKVCSNGASAVCKTATVTIVVLDHIDTVEDIVEVKEDETIEIKVLENDLFTGAVTVIGVLSSENGTVTLTLDGIVIYTPDANFNGEDVVFYTVTIANVDGTTKEELGRITITVLPVNDPPVAVDDAQVIKDGELEIVIDVLDNDFDLDGDVIVLQGATSPANGTVVLNADGTITYIPNPTFVGVDTFKYEICDGSGDCVTGTVSITVEIKDIVTPNAFSPNGDGHNDLFVIKGLAEKYPKFSMEIFNRWGNVVYTYSHNGNAQEIPSWWNGKSSARLTFNDNKLLPTGTYFYIIRFNDQKTSPLQSWVYLIK